MERFCAACRFVDKMANNELDWSFWKCTHPKCALTNVVSGKKYAALCTDARHLLTAACGSEGKLYEPVEESVDE